MTIGPFSFVNTTIIKFATIYWIATTLSTFIRKTAIISLPQISRFFRHVLRVRTWLIMPIPIKCHVTDNFAMFLATEFTLQNSRVVYSRKIEKLQDVSRVFGRLHSLYFVCVFVSTLKISQQKISKFEIPRYFTVSENGPCMCLNSRNSNSRGCMQLQTAILG